MSHAVVCFRCGTSLAAMPLPLSRQDRCPSCGSELHVCRMCRHYAPALPDECREDDAEAVSNKERSNFCDWFDAVEGAWDEARAAEQARAASELDALFGGKDDVDDAPGETDSLTSAAERLFR